MLKTLQRLFKQMKERYVVPRRVQDVIPIRRIWKDGIFLVGNCYTKTYQFTDINYLVASKADQDRMFKAYARIINSFDSTAITKLTISNHRINQQDFEDEVLMKEQGDGCDGYRQDYNSLIDAATSGSSGFLQEKYITVSVYKKSIDEARVFFQRVESDLGSSFLALGSKFSGLDTMQRLKMLHNFYRAARAAASAAQKAAIVSEKATERASKSVVKAFIRAVSAATKAALDATRELIVSIAAGGWVVLVAVIVVCLIGAFIASPFGILFSNEPTPGAMPLNVAVGQLNMELANTLEALQDSDYDSIDIQGESPDWREVVAVFASKTAGAHDGVDVAALTPDRVERLKAVFWDMCVITSEVETIEHPCEGEDEGWTEYILHITITAKTAEEMRTEYTFTSYQNEALTELLAELEPMKLLLTDLSVSQEQARALVANLPDDLAPKRRAVVETACRLVGKGSYYWGGKSLVLGWDSRWGQIQKVTADGNDTTGTYRPYGLDCSGFVDWVFYNATDGAYYPGHGGGATMQHSYCTPISWEDALPGDLVFYPGDEHVGIVGGWDENGELLIVHCASGYNCVVITEANGFISIGKPMCYPN